MTAEGNDDDEKFDIIVWAKARTKGLPQMQLDGGGGFGLGFGPGGSEASGYFG